MGLTYEQSEQLFREGEFAKLLTLSGSDFRTLSVLEPRLRVIVAHTLALSGELEIGRQLAELELQQAEKPATRSQAESTLGLVKWRNGDVNSALQHLQAAIRFAHESGDAERIAWSHLQLFRLFIDRHTTDLVMAMLPEVRRVVMRAGVAQAAGMSQ